MTANEELDIHLLSTDVDYLNSVIRKYCLYPPGNDCIAQEKGEYNTSELCYEEFPESQDATKDANDQVTEVLDEPVNTYDRSDGERKVQPTDEAYKELSTEELIRRLNSLNAKLWRSAEMMQKKASDNVKHISQLIRSTNGMPPPISDENLAESLRQCEMLATSVSRKYEQTEELRLILNLEKMLLTNRNALSLIHNWDETCSSLRKQFASYKAFCEAFSENRIHMFFSQSSDSFNHNNAIELRDMLLNFKASKDLYLKGDSKFSYIEEGLAEFMTEYRAILADLSEDIARTYFSLHGRFQDDSYDDSLPNEEVVFVSYIELYKGIFEANDSYEMIVSSFSSVIIRLLSLEFSTIWEDNNYSERHESDEDDLQDSLSTSPISRTIVSYFDAFTSTVNSKMDLFNLLFSTMESAGLLTSPKERLADFLTRTLEESLTVLGTVEDALINIEGGEFISTATDTMNTIESKLEDMLDQLQGIELKEKLSCIRAIPTGLLDRYVNDLNDLCFRMQWKPEHEDSDHSLQKALERFEKFLDYLSTVSVDSEGRLTASEAPLAYAGLSWMYNRFFFWNIHVVHSELMSNLHKEINSHFSLLLARDLQQDVSIDVELEWHNFLSSLMTSTNRLKNVINTVMLPLMEYPTEGPVLSKAVVNSVTIAEDFAIDCLTKELRAFITTPNVGDQVNRILLDDNHVVSAVTEHIVNYIASRASIFMANHYKAVTAVSSNIEEEPEISRNILLLGEYFTLLFPQYSEDEVLPLKILATAYTKFIDTELEALALLRPKDPVLRKQYRVDIAHLTLVSHYCGADVSEALEVLLRD